MNKSFLLSLLILTCAFYTSAQNPKFKSKYLKNISEESLKTHVYTLASDSLKGRDTGSEGEKKAANYIAQDFKQNGLLPFNDTTYFQNIGLWTWYWDECSIKTNKQTFTNYADFAYLSSAPISPNIKAKCIYIGNGSDTIINNLNLNGKIVLASVGSLRSWYRIASKTKKRGALAILLMHESDNEKFSKISEDMHSMHLRSSVSRKEPQFSSNLVKAFAINQSVAESLYNLSIDSLNNFQNAEDLKKLPQPKLSLSCPLIVTQSDAKNVVGYIPGNTKTNEAIVISAHYDHVGERHNGICYGADDNASGTAAVMELAKAFAPLKGKLDKDLVFLATSGEEKGLLGAFYFADHPGEYAFDIKANVNIDMIGRLDSTHKANYIYTIGNNHYPEFDSLLHVANNMIEPLTIQYDYNKSSGMGNFLNMSDHYAFHRKGIPVIGFFSGLHGDYHKPSDTPDKINYVEMQQRVKLIFTTTYLAAQKTAFTSQTD